MRLDQQLAEEWIQPNSRVLDLGCGDGDMLAHMTRHRGVKGYGIEIDEEKIARAVGRGLNIIQQDLNEGLGRFADQSFDYVVMAQALQAVDQPDVLLRDMLRVGREAIITFPNFAHWKTRGYLGFRGKMPMSEALPHTWYNTPNIHLCTFRDFEILCRDNNIRILSRIATRLDPVTGPGRWLAGRWPNLFGETAIYRVTNEGFQN